MGSASESFSHGLLRPELFLGVAASITAQAVTVNLSDAGNPSGSHFSGGRYGRGEVGEFVLIEGQQSLLLGRITEVRLSDADRRTIRPGFDGRSGLDAVGSIQLLGSVAMDDLRVVPGVDAYPRLGDRIYATPHQFIALLPRLMEKGGADAAVTLALGHAGNAHESELTIKPERLFGRHCAILGATGGGKSWTTARIVEECIKHKAKLILLDATGEYRRLGGRTVRHCHLGEPVREARGSEACCLPPTGFRESDFIALFEPSGKVQGPKLRAAIRSLRLAEEKPELATRGIILKHNKRKGLVMKAESDPSISMVLENPAAPFDVALLTRQLEQECVHPSGWGRARGERDHTVWGDFDDQNFAYCLSMIVRIEAVTSSAAFGCVFKADDAADLTKTIRDFVDDDDARLLRICLSGVSYEYNVREIIANTIGRQLLGQARDGDFLGRPLVVLVDEAHNFLGRHIGGEDHMAKLDAFELIAKEGRKYGLNLCLASQRPRDITEGVLSQMGTLIVHRLTNDRDREVIERACGEIDRSASAFLPNLRPGEAVILGTDFPIPLTVQISEPRQKPHSDGPSYQEHWARAE
jgi:hypothetical protein